MKKYEIFCSEITSDTFNIPHNLFMFRSYQFVVCACCVVGKVLECFDEGGELEDAWTSLILLISDTIIGNVVES